MKTRVYYNIAATTAAGVRCAWDSTEYPTFEEARQYQTLDRIRREAPDVDTLIIVEVTERDIVVERLIEGAAA